MKTTLGRRWLALLLTLVMCLTLAPAALADETAAPPALTGISVTRDNTELKMVEGKEDKTLTATAAPIPEGAGMDGLTYKWEVDSGDAVSVKGNGAKAEVIAVKPGSATVSVTASRGEVSGRATCSVTVETRMREVIINATGPIILEKGNQTDRALAATTDPSGEEVTWKSSDPNVATVSWGTVYARGPGRTEITASIGREENNMASDSIMVEVSGIKVGQSSISLEEEGSQELPRVEMFGVASGKTARWTSMDPSIAEVSGGQVVGRAPGRTTLEVSVDGGLYAERVNVEVKVGKSTIDLTGSKMDVNDTLSFSALSSRINAQAGGNLSHITGLRVDTAQGTLYYKYYSEAEPGAGVAQEGSYYLNPRTGQKGLSDITFVPKLNFIGGTVTISYTAVSDTYENYQCRILLSVEPRGSVPVLFLTTPYDTPVKLSGTEFDRICQELNGVGLNTVTFAQPSSRQGTLYTDYVGPGNYGSEVSTSRQYTRKELDDIWFVPAAGVTGPVTISYTARCKSSSGSVYYGSMTITVEERIAVKEGGPSYATANGGPVTFDDRDFESYRWQVLPNGNTLNHVQFDSLPGASQGVLYYDYRNISNPGSRVSAGISYYYNTRTPRLDRITFVPAEDFTGTVRIPFTAWDRDGSRFSGRVEIAVRGSSGSGDIRYTCSPGRSVSFLNSDFTSLCWEFTGRSLNYIVLEKLPDRYSEGSVYHNTNSRVTSTGTRYYANSTNPYRISRLSFQAASGFFGSVDIPFVGYATNGDSFDGVITIDSSGVTDWTIHYRADSGAAAVFNWNDFDSLSQWDSRENVRSVRFQIPSASQGDLYSGYRSSYSMGTRISSSSTAISRSSLNQVAFVPARNYTGTVYLDFTATSESGSIFGGTVEITVERAAADAAAHYYTQSAPVQFNAQDFRQGSRTLSSIRLNALPSSNEGRLYYRYTSPLRQEREADTRTSYRTSGSNLISDLTFVPRAGYTGTVVLPYTGTNSNGAAFEGEVAITVSPTRSSAYFSDMSGYSDAQRAAVDFCRENNITQGMSLTQFGPENSIRRGDFALMLYQAMELSPRYNSKPFRDVSSDAYYSEAVNTLRVMGIVSGVGGERYNPSGTLSRQDAVCMVQRAMQALGLGGYDGSVSYLNSCSDGGQVAGYAKGAMAFAIQEGYLPIRSGRLEPYQPLSRVDMAQMLHRVLTY